MSLISTVSWKSHISFVSKKISKTVGIIAKACFYLSSKSLLTLHYSLLYPYLTYCNVASSSTYCSNLNCIMHGAAYIQSSLSSKCTTLFSKLKALDIYNISSFSFKTLCIPITIIFCLVAFVTSF